MKFRIMQDANGRYVQVQNMFGIWRNWLIHSNYTTLMGRVYYEYSLDDITGRIEASNIKKNQTPELLKEFTV